MLRTLPVGFLSDRFSCTEMLRNLRLCNVLATSRASIDPSSNSRGWTTVLERVQSKYATAITVTTVRWR